MSKKVNLEFQDSEGNVIREDEVVLEGNDSLIVRGPEETTVEQMEYVMDALAHSLKKQSVVYIPDSFKIHVLKKK